MRHVGVWVDPEVIRLLKEWWEEGYSANLITDKFAALGIKVTKNSVIGKVHRLKLLRSEETQRIQRQPVRRIKYRSNPEKYIRFRPSPKHVNGGDVMVEKPNPGKRVLLRETKDGQCRAIIGYLNGVLADAVCCGEQAPLIIKGGRVAHSSWCPHHHEIYTIKGRYESSRGNAQKL